MYIKKKFVGVKWLSFQKSEPRDSSAFLLHPLHNMVGLWLAFLFRSTGLLHLSPLHPFTTEYCACGSLFDNSLNGFVDLSILVLYRSSVRGVSLCRASLSAHKKSLCAAFSSQLQLHSHFYPCSFYLFWNSSRSTILFTLSYWVLIIFLLMVSHW